MRSAPLLAPLGANGLAHLLSKGLVFGLDCHYSVIIMSLHFCIIFSVFN